MVTQNVQKSLQQLHSKARTTLKEVLTTGLKTCEDQQTESPVQISTNIPFKKTDKFRPRIWGNAEFEIQTDWLIGGRQMAVDQTCDELGGAIVITAKYKSQSLPVSVEWSRAYNGILLGDIKVTGNSCPITADDAGCVIKAAITPQRSANLGTAFVEVGPFDMDVSMKQSLLSYLGNKQASFSVDL
ncbi:hypothetical protein GNI_013340 [Gregarina niphandrodes]|uniref:Uncharacterized protein n=1 Tax=Gregarina niphandrodes TaxID=110365 RepID=A0A023BCG9_GRENI|nr:hypothetical protein GNI_013340 [Gregarina niphandrodes]EZG84059.1 hypothetical protein GNI_013340 [Gregarina niphandrodes]|eukprot:XP_011128877.1 hypothetical protein GNI_013340 [Gregarina niphandrodes]